MTLLYDTHIHLSDPEYSPYLYETIHNMKEMQTVACAVSMDPADSERTLEISCMSDLVIPFVGIHPERSSTGLDLIVEMIEERTAEIGGIGEIGLDPTYCETPEDHARQAGVFERLLSLAERYHKPVSIHSRKSIGGVLSILSSYSLQSACLHWFDGNKKDLRRAMEMDLFVSFGPVTVYANDKQGLLARTDPCRILVETDGPVRFSRCFEQYPAQISFIPSVILAISRVMARPYDAVCTILEENSRRFLGI